MAASTEAESPPEATESGDGQGAHDASTAEKARTPWRYLAPYKGVFAFGVLMLIATNLLSLAMPYLLGQIIDGLKTDHPGEVVPRLALLMVVFAAGTAVTRIASRVALFNTARDAEYDLRADLFGHLLLLEPGYYRARSTGDVMSRLTNDVQTVRALWGPGVLNIINTAVVFSSVLTMMIRIDPWLTLLACIPYPSIVIFGRLFGRRLYRASRVVQAQLGKLSSAIQEDLTGINIIKTYALEDQRRGNFRDISENLLERNMQLTNVRGQLMPTFSAMSALSAVIVLWFGGKSVITGDITLGRFVEFSSYLGMLIWPTMALGWMLSLFQRGFASWGRIKDIMLYPPAIADGPGPDLDDVRGDVSIRGLSIEIDGKRILDDISVEMPAGTVTAIVGRTGSGKSTLIEALPRLIDVPEGTIFLDDRDINDLPLGTLRHAIGYAPQEAFLFSASIAKNIAFGYERVEKIADAGKETSADAGEEAITDARKSEPAPYPSRTSGTAQERRAGRAVGDPDERLVAAAAGAGLSRDLSALPDGYDTLVGERGITLSGGQRQRVALARALATMPRVLILDDSLSSVDAETEREILGHLTEIMAGRTAILISHRVAAVKRADQIVCLDEGRVVEVGTHDELLAAGGVYAEVYQTQLEPESIDDGESAASEGGSSDE